MKILVGIPCLYNAEMCKLSILSVAMEADVLVIDNGADYGVKQMIKLLIECKFNIRFISNEQNIFVNPAWNQILHYFLQSDYDQLIIMNSDLVMKPGWSNRIQDGISCIPTDGSHLVDTVVSEGTTGVFIHLNKEMARLAYPIPYGIKIWFGDNFLYGKIRKAGFQTIIRTGMLCEHIGNGSQTIGILPNKAEIIEQDKIAWAEIEKTL